MSTRNLDSIFRARSIALIGASARENSVGFVIARNLLHPGFSGRLDFVNPKYTTLLGHLVYPDVASLPEVPELAVLCTPAVTIPGLVETLAQRGCKGAVVITAGFRELGTEAALALEKRMLEAARPHLFRILGPNCLGILATAGGINASFAPSNAKPGGLAFIAQSGAIATTMLDWANSSDIGFSHLVSLGDMSDVDFGDMLDYLADDPDTSAILLYIEAVTHARKFLSAARSAARLKPVIAIKAGRHAAAARAAASHTGALAGIDEVYDAAFARAGIVRVGALGELFEAAETLAVASAIASDGLVIVTNGGGAGVLATDALSDLGGTLTDLLPETVAKLDAVLPPTWSRANPVDIIGDAPPARYVDALSVLLEAEETTAMLVINCPTAVSSSSEAAKAVADLIRSSKKPVLTNWLGAKSTRSARAYFAEARVPTYETPEQAVRGFMHLVRYRKGQETLLEIPGASVAEFRPDERRARTLLSAALTQPLQWLSPEQFGEILECYGIPMASSLFARTPEEAGRCGLKIGGPVALKIVSPDITHKADIGGVVLDLEGQKAICLAAEAMILRVAHAKPGATIDGFLVQQIVRRPDAYEVILGAATDQQFGPFLLFGEGGSAVEIIADKAIALPPLNIPLARDMIAHTRIYGQLKGYRHRPPVALEELELTLVKLSQLICDLDEIVEIEINPLLVDSKGVIAIDGRARIAPIPLTPRGARLAIRPYPKQLEREENVAALGKLLVRPVRPDDLKHLSRILQSIGSPRDGKGLVTQTRRFVPQRLARLSQIDYDREMTFLMLRLQRETAEEGVGFAYLAADPDNYLAEFSLAVHADFQGRGAGTVLINRIIEYARERGITELYGDVASQNTVMLSLCEQAGFTQVSSGADATRVKIRLRA